MPPEQSVEDRNRGLVLGCGATNGVGKIRTWGRTLGSVELEGMLDYAAPEDSLYCAARTG